MEKMEGRRFVLLKKNVTSRPETAASLLPPPCFRRRHQASIHSTHCHFSVRPVFVRIYRGQDDEETVAEPDCRSVADSPQGSISHGSEGMMTRARRRRLLAESSERSGANSEASVQDLAAVFIRSGGTGPT
jgi:hypothetical protein